MEHVRIDEGIERGPRKTPAQWPARKPPIAGKLEGVNPFHILDRYLQGEELADIAVTLGVSASALNYHLLKPDIKERWKEAQVAVSLTELHEAKDVVRQSPDALSLARGKVALMAAQWDLERLRPDIFGQKQELTVSHTIPQDVAKEIAALTHELGVARMGQVAVQQLPVIDVVDDPQPHNHVDNSE